MSAPASEGSVETRRGGGDRRPRRDAAPPIRSLSAEPAIFAPADSNQIFDTTLSPGAVAAQEGGVPSLSNTRRDS